MRHFFATMISFLLGVKVKSLIILGVPRSGKTTLAKSILELFSADEIPVSFLSADSIIGGLTDVQKSNLFWRIFVRPLRHVFPKMRKQTKTMRVNQMLAFVGRFINETSDITPVVYEGAYITPDDAVKIFNQKKCMIVVIGYPKSAVDAKVRNIRHFDKKTPYTARTNDQLISLIRTNIERSVQMEKQAKKHKLMFIDTSTDYTHTIKTAAHEIYKKLSK